MTFADMFTRIRELIKDPGSGSNAYHTDDYLLHMFNIVQKHVAATLPPPVLPELFTKYQYTYSDQTLVSWNNIHFGEFANIDIAQFIRAIYRIHDPLMDSGYSEQPVQIKNADMMFETAAYIQPTRFAPVIYYSRLDPQLTTNPTDNRFVLMPALEEDDTLVVVYIYWPTEPASVSDATECNFNNQLENYIIYETAGRVLASALSPDNTGANILRQQAQQMLLEYLASKGIPIEMAQQPPQQGGG